MKTDFLILSLATAVYLPFPFLNIVYFSCTLYVYATDVVHKLYLLEHIAA